MVKPMNRGSTSRSGCDPVGTGGRSTSLARLVADQATALHINDLLAESLDPETATTAAFEGPDGRWTVEIHFAEAPDEAATRDLVAGIAGKNAAQALAFETVAARDWVAASLAGLEPVEAGRFVIHGAHDRTRVAPSRIGIEIEAALAFGTGHHGTTRGCLLALDGLVKRRKPRAILDLGAGTGVLAIAAARALHRPVLATDIDLQAVRIAAENARLNRVGPLVACIQAAGADAPILRARAPFDLVLANILLSPLTRLARALARLLAPDARLAVAGLLRAQENAALAIYRAHGLTLEKRILRDEWVTLVLRNPRPLTAARARQ